jgi:iron(III) transport system substrate-binding protein
LGATGRPPAQPDSEILRGRLAGGGRAGYRRDGFREGGAMGERIISRRGALRAAAGAVAVGCAGPADGPGGPVVVYAALDREFSEPVLVDAAAALGLRILPKYDIESTKTVGLASAIAAERARPICDLFWNNEILHTLRLKRQGLLAPLSPPPRAAARIPAPFRDPDGTWFGFAARARILLVNTEVLPDAASRPASLLDLAAPAWKGRCAIAKPLFGTTATHAACLFAAWGSERARGFFTQLRDNGVQVLSGNKGVAQAVAAGDVAFGLTDTDDALVELDAGRPVAIVYPDQAEGALGTLFIPNTLAAIRGAPHPVAAARLADAIVSALTERRLAVGPSGQIPLFSDPPSDFRIATPRSVRPMPVDFAAAADRWDEAAAFLAGRFAG